MSRVTRLLGASLLLGSVGCVSGGDGDGEPSGSPDSQQASLQRAVDCPDLLTRIQDDAVAKLDLVVEREKAQATMRIDHGGGLTLDAGSVAPRPGSSNGDGSGVSGPPLNAGNEDTDVAGGGGKNPTGSSDTNTQVANVDEADFVKVVDSGRGIYFLHGNTLQKLKSWPASETALVGAGVRIEGSPSEMFVTDEGKAVVFSTVYVYSGGSTYGGGGSTAADAGRPSSGSSGGATPADVAAPAPDFPTDPCSSGYCKGSEQLLKITVVDLSGAAPVVERELYYEGSLVSSRRYDGADTDVVRAIIQSQTKYQNLFYPQISWTDSWGRMYDQVNIDAQLDEWRDRTEASIRNTVLSDWLPGARELRDGRLVTVEPSCGDYYMPVAGLSDYGLTHVVSLDVSKPGSAVGGVTIVGATSTVYSTTDKLVLAQPDYRWNQSNDFGVQSQQQTALHVFALANASTSYQASGWVPGHLPLRNPQFGIDIDQGGIIRLATTGFVRNEPEASPQLPGFWLQHTENRVLTARVNGTKVELVAQSDKLGHEGESVYSARFVGDRAYVVTFRQTDPLIVVDVSNAASLPVLGEIEIPGFSEYMHPLDATHLITVGQSAQRGIQLQLFDVTNPQLGIAAPKVLDLGAGATSEVSYNHKALTVYKGVLALPLSSNTYNGFRSSFRSSLELIKVDANTGFTQLGSIDHAPLFASNGVSNGCGVCDMTGCYDYVCSYAPEVRRGHFVEGDGKTYVYSFSHAGVLVNDLASPTQSIARVGLPQPAFDGVMPWYGTDGGTGPVPVQDAGTVVMPVDPLREPERDGGVRDGAASDLPIDPSASDAGVASMPPT